MFGENLQLITIQCCVCKKWVAMRVDPEDLASHGQGMFVQHTFVQRDGKPYLTAAERELFVSECCDACYHLLCPSDPLAYS